MERIIASARNWVEGSALEQFRRTAALPGIRVAVALPDIHPGLGYPIGAAFGSDGIVYPHLVGNDVGCGIGLWRTDLSAGQARLDRWTKCLTGLDEPFDGDRQCWLLRHQARPGDDDSSLGTIGGGNHFAELQRVERVEDEAAFQRLGLDAGRLMLLVHSGSRGRGQTLLQGHQQGYGAAGLPVPGDASTAYLSGHEQAMCWARANRDLIAHRFLALLSTRGERVLDLTHNSVTRVELAGKPVWIHRKGAAPSDQGPLVIPGSRGAWSYLVAPQGSQEGNAYCLAHGAGRKWARKDCEGRLRDRFTAERLTRTELGSRVLCDDRDLLYEEAPQAYKNIDIVISDMLEAGLIHVIAVLRPLITYKTRRKGR